jgi:Intracellular proteinase inhibitor
MRRRFSPARARGLALLALSLAAGCRTAAIYVPAVKSQLTVEPTQVRAGETVRLAVTVVNPQADTVVLEFGGDCGVTYMVMDSTSRVVDSGGGEDPCLAPGTGRLVLAPGATWDARAEWRASRAGGDPLPPGAYSVAAILEEHESVQRGKRSHKLGSRIGTLPIRVLPAGGR